MAVILKQMKIHVTKPKTKCYYIQLFLSAYFKTANVKYNLHE